MKLLPPAENTIPLAKMQGTGVARHLPKQPQIVASPFQPSFPCFTSLGGHLCCHSAAGKPRQHRPQQLGCPHMALISNSAQATATSPGSQLESL